MTVNDSTMTIAVEVRVEGGAFAQKHRIQCVQCLVEKLECSKYLSTAK